MASEYKQILDMSGEISETILRVEDQAYIPPDPANRDRQEYDEWLAEGNTPDPPDPLPEPPPPEPVQLPANPEAPMDATTKIYVDAQFVPIVQHLEELQQRLEALERRLA